MSTETERWICESCGFIYDPADGDPDGGIPPGTAFEDIPDTWFCPVCGARKRDFTLYEDDGLSYDYEKGASSRIPIHWDDHSRTLTIGERSGSFKGMLKTRTFDVVLISKDQPRAYDSTSAPTKTVKYIGREIKLSFQ